MGAAISTRGKGRNVTPSCVSLTPHKTLESLQAGECAAAQCGKQRDITLGVPFPPSPGVSARGSATASCALTHTVSVHDGRPTPRASADPPIALPAEAPPLLDDDQHRLSARTARPALSALVLTAPPADDGHDAAGVVAVPQLATSPGRSTSATLNGASVPMYGVDVVQVEQTSPHKGGVPAELDDFEVAYARVVQNGDITTVPDASIAAVQYCRPLPRTPSRSGYGVPTSLIGPAQSLSAPELGVTCPPLYMPSDVDETLAFVTLRRAGFSTCRRCTMDLPYQARFCPQCGAAVAKPAAGDDGSSSPSPATASLFHTSITSRSPSVPELAAGAAESGQDGNVFTLQRRRAFVRHVKVLRSRATLGVGSAGTVYRAVDTRNGQQLAVKESIINQNSAEELATVRNELRQLAELRHPFIVEYFGCRVEVVEDSCVLNRQSSVISSHNSAVASRRGSCHAHSVNRRGSVSQRSASLTVTDEQECSTELTAAAASELRRRNVEAAAVARLRRRASTASSTIRVLTLMERVECGTLGQLLAEFPRGLPEQAVRRFTAQLIDAVCYVHDRGLSHRDIKLDNILLASDGTIRLSDFGCAVRGVTGLPGKSVHSIAGTPAYMPPEALACLGGAPVDWTVQGKAQDVWAVGCAVHHLLTATAPWSSMRALHPYALLVHIQTHSFPLAAEALSKDALDFCRRCLESDPQKRSSVAELSTHPFVDSPKRRSQRGSLFQL